MSQQELILEKLNDGQWHCSNELIDLYSVDYRSVINKLRKKGYEIIGKPCDMNHTHKSRKNKWYLQLYNFNGKPIQNEPNEPTNSTQTQKLD